MSVSYIDFDSLVCTPSKNYFSKLKETTLTRAVSFFAISLIGHNYDQETDILGRNEFR
jgi:hypothetical protein